MPCRRRESQPWAAARKPESYPRLVKGVTLDHFFHPHKISCAARHGGPPATKTISSERERSGLSINIWKSLVQPPWKVWLVNLCFWTSFISKMHHFTLISCWTLSSTWHFQNNFAKTCRTDKKMVPSERADFSRPNGVVHVVCRLPWAAQMTLKV